MGSYWDLAHNVSLTFKPRQRNLTLGRLKSPPRGPDTPLPPQTPSLNRAPRRGKASVATRSHSRRGV
eukprot:4232445-Pyramimonas_sp.AAC.1